MIQRNITSALQAALSDTPVVLLHGARQTGKSTLAQWLAKHEPGRRYITFDNASMLAAAGEDPEGFLAGLEKPVVLDEIQRVPALFLAIKSDVDASRRPGRYLLTGSANIQLLPQLSELLVGRMEILTLWPFSAGELERSTERFVDTLFSPDPSFPESEPVTKADLIDRIIRGGYPEVVSRESLHRRKAWYNSYMTTITQRDVRDLASIERLSVMHRLLGLVAARTASLLNYSELSRSLGVPQSTLKRYFTLLEGTFLVKTLLPWSANLSKRIVKSPKVFLNDTGLVTALLDLDSAKLTADPTLTGRVLETFVAMELVKQISWSHTRPYLYHFRTQSGDEVDFVLENSAGDIVGIEVKTAAAVKSGDLKGLRYLQTTTGSRFRRGIVLYAGSEMVPFSKNLHALPVNTLWQINAKTAE